MASALLIPDKALALLLVLDQLVFSSSWPLVTATLEKGQSSSLLSGR